MDVSNKKDKKGIFAKIESRILNKLKETGAIKFDDKNKSIIIKFSRLLDYWISSKIIKTKITPNQITFLSVITLLISAFFFLLATHLFIILGALFFLIGHILDGVDGVLARMKGMSSKYGDFLDNLAGLPTRAVVFFCIAWGVFNTNHDYSTWIFVYLAITSLLIKNYTQTVFFHNFSFSKNVSKEIYTKFKFLMLFRYNVWFYLPVMLFFAIINNMYLFLLIFGIYGPIYTIIQIYVLIKKAKKYSKK